MLSAKEVALISTTRRFLLFRAYSDATPVNNGMEQGLCRVQCLSTLDSFTAPIVGRPKNCYEGE